MWPYIIRRMLLIPLTVGMLITIFFFMLRTIPGDFVDYIYQEQGTTLVDVRGSTEAGGKTTQDAYADAIRERYGIADPAHIQFVKWIGRILHGDFGFSFLSQQKATEVLINRLPASIQLGLMGITGAVLLGIPLGIFAARFPDTWVDNVIRVFSLAGLSVPIFVTAAVIIVILSVFFYWVPPEYTPLTRDPMKNLANMTFPAMVVSYSASAPLMRLTRSQMLEVMAQDYIRTARAKGLEERTIFFKHGLRNTLLPVVTVVGASLNLLVAGSVITETVFGIRGMGAELVRAAVQRDFPVLQLFVLVFGGFVMIMNLLIDLTYGIIDPRIRYN